MSAWPEEGKTRYLTEFPKEANVEWFNVFPNAVIRAFFEYGRTEDGKIDESSTTPVVVQILDSPEVDKAKVGEIFHDVMKFPAVMFVKDLRQAPFSRQEIDDIRRKRDRPKRYKKS